MSRIVEWATESDWQQALIEGAPFLDVRAPIEFIAGSAPGAQNLPLINDEERHLVGLCYKQNGPDAALALGHALVSGVTRSGRIALWADYLQTHSTALLYCFRGGQRSQIAQTWLRQEARIHVPRISGGYKAIRQFLLSQLELLPDQLKFLTLAGQTGSGKTLLLRELAQDLGDTGSAQIVDLENLANHRGSAFGRGLDPQPSVANFENRLAATLLRARRRPEIPVLLEDEARTIGQVGIPQKLFGAMRSCPLVVIDEPRSSRAQVILQEYVEERFKRLLLRCGTDLAAALAHLENDLIQPIHRISRKLGGVCTTQVLTLLHSACAETRSLLSVSGPISFLSHLPWIDFLLEHYYDPFYNAHFELHKHRVVCQDSRFGIGARFRIRDSAQHSLSPLVF